MEKDAQNDLLWKFSKRRLEAEEIRDSMLAIAGRLNPKIGGPSVMVPIDPELVKMLKRPQYWIADSRQIRVRPPHAVHDLQAQSAAAVRGSVRRARYSALLRPPRAVDACAAGARTAEREDLERTGRGLRAAPAEGDAKRRSSGSITPGVWRPAARPPRPRRTAALKFLGEKPDDPETLKEFALAVFNLNAFLYVN